MINAAFKSDGCTTIRIGADLMLPNASQPRGYVAMLLEREALIGPMADDGQTAKYTPPEVTTLAVWTPSQARAVASAILAAATEARG